MKDLDIEAIRATASALIDSGDVFHRELGNTINLLCDELAVKEMALALRAGFKRILAERDAARAELAEAVSVLRECEWSGDVDEDAGDGRTCPWCGYIRPGPHLATCRLAAVLRKADERSKP